MIKKNFKQLIISSVIILLPILAGLLLWDRLPDTVATHWGMDGNADGWGSKTLAVFVPPLIMLATHWLCVLVTSSDPGNKNRNQKAKKMVLWTMPLVSLFSSALLYGTALGAKLNFASITFALVGVMFVGIGNYLPKVSQNYTIGIKVPWALHSEENWHATHRFGGKVWVIGGLALVLMAFLPMEFTLTLMVIVLLIMGFTPMIYSYLFYKKNLQPGTARVYSSPHGRISLLIVGVFLVFLALVMFTGSIEYEYSDTSLRIESDRWDDLTIPYGTIDSIEYREEMVSGSREWGFGSPKLLLGRFQNDEFGYFTRYTYGSCDSCIVLYADGEYFVISGKNAAETAAIYDALTARWEG